MIWLNTTGSAMLLVGLTTALIDYWMNKPYASWTPWGLGMAGIGLILVEL